MSFTFQSSIFKWSSISRDCTTQKLKLNYWFLHLECPMQVFLSNLLVFEVEQFLMDESIDESWMNCGISTYWPLAEDLFILNLRPYSDQHNILLCLIEQNIQYPLLMYSVQGREKKQIRIFIKLQCSIVLVTYLWKKNSFKNVDHKSVATLVLIFTVSFMHIYPMYGYWRFFCRFP